MFLAGFSAGLPNRVEKELARGCVASRDVRWAGRSCVPLYLELLHWPSAPKPSLGGLQVTDGSCTGPCQH